MRRNAFVGTLLLACLLAGAAAAVRAEESPAEKEVRQRREALLKAVNARDARAVGAFMAPSFEAKQKDGQTIARADVLKLLAAMFQNVRSFTESLKIEKLVVNGDTAEITNASVISFTDQQGNRHRGNSRYQQTWKKINGKWLMVKELAL